MCHDVRVERCLQSLSGEVFSCRSANTAPDARADVRARGFWTRGEDAFFDVRVFHPNAPSYVDCSPASLFSRHKHCKRREYEERIVNIERGLFTQVVLATPGACGPAADCFIERLAGQLGEHDRQPYSMALGSESGSPSHWCGVQSSDSVEAGPQGIHVDLTLALTRCSCSALREVGVFVRECGKCKPLYASVIERCVTLPVGTWSVAHKQSFASTAVTCTMSQLRTHRQQCNDTTYNLLLSFWYKNFAITIFAGGSL